MKINELIEINKAPKNVLNLESDSYFEQIKKGYDYAVDEISQIEIPPEKLVGMVEIDIEKLAHFLKDEIWNKSEVFMDGTQRKTFPLTVARAIAANKSSILKLKPTLD